MPPCLKFHINVELDQVRQKKNTGKKKGGQIKKDLLRSYQLSCRDGGYMAAGVVTGGLTLLSVTVSKREMADGLFLRNWLLI
jgi:hypothetical protein